LLVTYIVVLVMHGYTNIKFKHVTLVSFCHMKHTEQLSSNDVIPARILTNRYSKEKHYSTNIHDFSLSCLAYVTIASFLTLSYSLFTTVLAFNAIASSLNHLQCC